ncbi:MAG TPA: TIGR02147 family protein [Bdellovibrionota bacterium]|nr:TIGR02147 family protein [Bdellovibrionota bacterium]
MDQIFSYTNYREFLRDYYTERKSKNGKFSFRVFARLAQFGSPGYLKMIMDGQRNISHGSIYKLVKAMKLPRRESEYFEKLVLFNQSQDVDEQKELLDLLDSIRRTKPSALISEYQATIYSKWFYLVVREMVRLADFKEDPAWISERLKRKITPSDAKDAIEKLLECGLLKRTDDGKLVQNERTISWTGEVANLAVRHFHHSMIQQGLDFMKVETPRDLRDYSGLLVAISTKEDLEFIKESLRNLRLQLNERLSQTKENDEVFTLNLQWFPLTGPVNGSKE